MTTCKACLKECRYILLHLKNNPTCQKDYDMLLLKKEAQETYKVKKRAEYHNNSIMREEKRKRYRLKQEQVKVRRRIRYEENHEKEEERERARYRESLETREHEKLYNRKYHQANRNKILPKMKMYDNINKPRRAAINKLKKQIQSYQRHWFTTDEAFHLYHHSVGKCDQNTVFSGRHSIQQSNEVCKTCASPAYKLSSCNKVQCVRSSCGMTHCYKCQIKVSSNPLKDFEHFYLNIALMPGMCPLFEDFDTFSGHKCSTVQPCYSPKPSIIPIDDYKIGPGWHVPPIACAQCKVIEVENPNIITTCRKIQKHEQLPDHKLKCFNIGRDLTDTEKKNFLENKEYHFFNCHICGWTTNKENCISSHRFVNFSSEVHKTPLSVDQNVIYIDYPNSPEQCFIGSELISH